MLDSRLMTDTHSSISPTPVIVRVALPVPLDRLFDYRLLDSSQRLQPGMRVRVPFGKRILIGIVMDIHGHTECEEAALKSVIEILDEDPIVEADLRWLCQFVADYYHAPIGQVFENALPALLRKGHALRLSKRASLSVETLAPLPLLTLTADQQNAIDQIQSATDFSVFLLYGITGSGKTEVYLAAMEKILQAGKQVLMLVPEIGLTPQTIQRFKERLPYPMVSYHSKMSDRERLDAWLQVRSGAARMIIGTRSSVFLPFKNLGFMVLDEEHDTSYKQQDRVRYHARDVCVMRARYQHIPIVLGSATPSLESFYNVKKEKYDLLTLNSRPNHRVHPCVDVIDVRHQTLHGGLSSALLTAIRAALDKQEQVLLFLNRRGYAPILMCHPCGWMAMCHRCDRAMTLHQSPRYLHCHHCDQRAMLPKQCPSCSHKEIHTVGVGTEQLEETLRAHFPLVNCVRVDRDNTQGKYSFEEIVTDIRAQRYQIILGTQMLAKGHDFPNITLVAMIDVDGGFFSSDFRAMENMAQLIRQVAGRAGRADKKGQVMIQTHHPDHPLLHHLLSHTYDEFSELLLTERKRHDLPPYTAFTMIRAQAPQLSKALDFLEHVKLMMPATVCVLGPVPAVQPKRAGVYRAQLLLQMPTRILMQKALQDLPQKISQLKSAARIRWHIDVDPIEVI